MSWSKRATRHSTDLPNRGSTSSARAYHGTKLELCSISVVTTLSPSRNSLSSEYMTALIASVVFRYVAMLRRLGALIQVAIVS